MVNETDLPVLTAVPVKKSGVDLPEADFEAWPRYRWIINEEKVCVDFYQ